MGRAPRSRAMVLGERLFRWTLTHRHARDARGEISGCIEALRVSLASRRGASLVIEFLAGEVMGAEGLRLHSGGVSLGVGGGYLNLHEPGVVRGLIEVAMARGWSPEEDAQRVMDGWGLLPEVIAGREGQLGKTET